jgi:hypothetical protein
MTPERIDDPRDQAAQPSAAANPAGASRLQSLRPVGRVAELGSLDHFKRMFRALTIIFIAAAMTGCCCLHDARGPSNTCEVHHMTMRSTTAPGWGGCVLPTIQYAETRTRLFPNASGDYMPSPWPWKRQRVYVCDDCIRAKDEWIKNH